MVLPAQEIQAPTLTSTRDLKQDRALFLALLLVATLAPLLLMPVLARVGQSASITSITNLMLFLGTYGHVASTAFFYTDRSLRGHFRQRFLRYYVAPPLLIVGAGVLYQALAPVSLAYFLLFYFCWQTHHYMRQNYGMLAFVSKAVESPRPHWLERVILNIGVIAGILAMIRWMGLYENTLIGGYEILLYETGLALYMAIPFLILLVLRAQPGILHSPVRLGFLLICAAFYLPSFLFRDVPSAVLSYAIAHGFQYFVFMYYVGANRRQLPHLRGLAFVGLFALAGGAGLALLSDTVVWGAPARFAFGCYLGAVMSHFVVDAGIWRLSETFQREYLSEPFDFVLAPRQK